VLSVEKDDDLQLVITYGRWEYTKL